MPFFSSKFLQKKLPRRKTAIPLTNQNTEDESSFNNSNITLNLGDLVTTFDNEQWISQTSGNTNRENLSLKVQINQLEEENNLLKLKCEILLDMLVEEFLSHQL